MITSNSWFAGTDNTVEIALSSEDDDTDVVKLTNSTTRKNPFERGQTDKFIVELNQSEFFLVCSLTTAKATSLVQKGGYLQEFEFMILFLVLSIPKI